MCGAADTVTGSKFLVNINLEKRVFRILIDCGSHQGADRSDRENYLPKGITANLIDCVLITHAHIDHSGMLPKLYRDGFRGFVVTHPATLRLLELLLADSANIQKFEASTENKRRQRRSQKFQPVEALYTHDDVHQVLQLVRPIEYNEQMTLAPDVSVIYKEAAHLLGAATVTIIFGKGEDQRVIVDNANIGRPQTTIYKPLQRIRRADVLLAETTYGNDLHDKRDRLKALANILNDAYKRALESHPVLGCGKIVIPAFSVGRVQSVLYDIRELIEQGRIRNIPVFVEGVMANKATQIYREFSRLFNDKTRAILARGKDPFATPQYVECVSSERHREVMEPANQPIIIIGSAGMANAGRIRAHVERCLPGRHNTILFCGHQEPGTLGYKLTAENPYSVRMGKNIVRCKATIELMKDYSGHADYEDTLNWLKQFEVPPTLTILKHGEMEAMIGFKEHMKKQLPNWKVCIPNHRQVIHVY